MAQRNNFSVSTILGGLAEGVNPADAATVSQITAGGIASIVNDTLVFSTSPGTGGLQLDWAIDTSTEEVSNVQLVFPNNAQTNRNVQVPINDSTGAPLELGSPWKTGDGIICYWTANDIEFVYLGIIDTTGTARNFIIQQNENWDRNAPPPVGSGNTIVNGVKIRRMTISNNSVSVNGSTYPNVNWINSTDNVSGARVNLSADLVGDVTSVYMNVSEPDIKEFAQEQVALTVGSTTPVGKVLNVQTGTGQQTNIVSIIWDGTRFLALLSDGNLYSSTTGTGGWGLITRIDTATTFVEIAYSGGNYVAVGNGGKTFHSSNLTAWTLIQLPVSNNCTSVAAGGNIFIVTQVVVGSTSAIYASADGGVTFTAGTIPTGAGNSLRSVVYNTASNAGFLAVGDNGLAYASANGTSWLQITTNSTTNFQSVAYGVLNNFASFVVSGPASTGGISCGYTPNGGTNWLFSTVGSGTRVVTASAFCGDRFLVCSYDATNTTGYISYSTDGQNWYEYANSSILQFNSLAYNNLLAVFGTAGGSIYTSVASNVFDFATPPENAITSIANAQITANAVTGLNTLKSNVSIIGGGDTTATTSGQTITVSSTSSAPVVQGTGWQVGCFIDTNAASLGNAWTGAANFPCFLTNGTVVGRSGFILNLRPGGGGWDFPADNSFLISALQTWHNAFSDALTLTVTANNTYYKWSTSVPPLGAVISQTDAAVKALFNITNPNAASNTIEDFNYDDSVFPFVRGVATRYAAGINVLDEGTSIVANANTLNFTGTGVAVTNVNDVATINVPGNTGNAIMYWAKTANQVLSSAGTVTFNATPTFSSGTAFGPMASTGIFTFTTGGYYSVTYSYNVSASPDGWGVFSALSNRILEHTTSLKGNSTQVINVTSNGQTLSITENNPLTIFSNASSAGTSISITKLA